MAQNLKMLVFGPWYYWACAEEFYQTSFGACAEETGRQKIGTKNAISTPYLIIGGVFRPHIHTYYSKLCQDQENQLRFPSDPSIQAQKAKF